MAIFTEEYCIDLLNEQQSQSTYYFQGLELECYKSKNPQKVIDAANKDIDSIWKAICKIVYDDIYNSFCHTYTYSDGYSTYSYTEVDEIWYEFEKDYRSPDAIKKFIFLSRGKIEKDTIYINLKIQITDIKYKQFNFDDIWVKIFIFCNKIKCWPAILASLRNK